MAQLYTTKSLNEIAPYLNTQSGVYPNTITTNTINQPQKRTLLEDALAGLGNTIGNVGKGLYGMFGSAVAGARDLAEGTGDKYTTEFQKSVFGADENGNLDTKKALGTTLDAATTIGSFIPGVGIGKTAASTVGKQAGLGAVGGAGATLANGGTLEDALKGASAGALAGGAVGGANIGLANKIANSGNLFKGTNVLSRGANKIANSNIGRSALSGGIGGAVGGGTSAALNGGDIASGALQGAGAGATGGAIFGLGANLANKVPGVGNNGIMGALNEVSNDFQQAVANGQTYYRNKNKATNGIGSIKDTYVVGDILNRQPRATASAQTEPTYGLVNGLGNEVAQQNNTQLATQPESDIMSAFNQIDTPITNRNRLQSAGERINNTSRMIRNKGLLDSLDAKTAQRAVSTGAIEQLDSLDVRPQDYAEYAKTSNYVNKTVSELAKKSGVMVNLPDLPEQLSANNIDVIMSDSALRKYNDYIGKIVADGDSPTQYSASYLLEKSREIGNKAATLRGNNDDVKALRSALTDAKYVLRDAATNALENTYVTGDDTAAQIAQGLAKLGANEKVQDYYTNANESGNAPTVADYIRRSSLFEQAREMGLESQAEKYVRSASKAPTKVTSKLLSASGLDEPIQGALSSTVAPLASKTTELLGSAVTSAGNLANRIANSGAGNIGSGTISAPANSNNELYNLIGRANANQQIGDSTAQTIGNATQNYQTAEPMQNDIQDANQQMATTYNTVGTPVEGQLYTMVQPANANTVEGTLNTVGTAINLAIQAGDLDSASKLMSMYSNLAEIYDANSGSSLSDLSTTEKNQLAKLDSAETAINQLEGLYNQAGGAQGLVGGNINSFLGGIGLNSGASTYNQMSEGLINQIAASIGKTDSLNTEGEVKRALQLVPKLTDDAVTAQNKLNQLRQMLESNKQTYYSVYGLS